MFDDDERSPKSRGSNELVLNPGEYAFLQDNTKGNVQTFVGPIVITQTGQLRPILFSESRFSETNLQDAAVQCVSARKGEYLVLENPTVDNDGLKHPDSASNNTSAPDLRHGEKIVVPGPVEFAPWPQQSAILIGGHHLRPDQYLLVRIYDEDAAVANWGDAIVKTSDDNETVASKAAKELGLSLGKLLIIRDVSFYIPPTGAEVIPTENGEYVRDALTLEMSEYAILVDSNGNKRYEPGPQIVFPKPTEEFFEENGSIKFKPIELTPTQGLHIKINCGYKDETWPVASVIDANADTPDADATRYARRQRRFKEGDEVFITGATHPIYYPREEHSIVRYGDNLIHYATAVGAGQARYVMNKGTGKIVTRRGPDMILLNSIEEVFVTRVLSDTESNLMYPGNTDSLAYNRSLQQFQADRETGALTSAHLADDFAVTEGRIKAARSMQLCAATEAALPNQIKRSTTSTKPYSVTLDDRFTGAPDMNVWTGFAMLLVKANGDRRIEVGPKVVTLDFDEKMAALHLSTGKPKTTNNLLTTGYLEVANNKVSDILDVETSDGVHVELKLSYRVSFTGDKEQWFNIDNYVKFLCDHCRSLLKGITRRHTIRNFYIDPAALIRDTILGPKDGEKERTGRLFKENGMTITDVEVLDVTISDADIGSLLQTQQQEVVTNQIAIDRATQQLEVAIAQAANKKSMLKLLDEIRQLEQELELSRLTDHAMIAEAEAAETLKRLQEQDTQAAQEQVTKNANHEGKLKRRTNMVDLELRQNEAETANVVSRFEAANGDLAAAIRQLGDEQLLEKVAEAMGPMRIIGGGTITDALAGLIGGKGELFNRLTAFIDDKTE